MGQYQRGDRRDEQAAPKPFDFVPLPERVNRSRPTGHDKFQSNHISGQIRGKIEALSPVHIGSGIIDIGDDVELIKTAVKTGGNIVLPGSSLKGAIRSVVEAISESCLSKVSSQVRRAMPRWFSECRQKENLCVACRMFGAMGFQGNISIQDAPRSEGDIVTKHVPELYAPGRGQRSMREIPGRKFYMHGEVATGSTSVQACEKETQFRFVMQVDNLKQSEWGLLFTALGHHPNHSFKLKIGGAKPVCFGSIDFQIDEIQVQEQTRNRYLNWDVPQDFTMTDETLQTWTQTCIENAEIDRLIQQELLLKLTEILKYPNDRNCPTGLY